MSENFGAPDNMDAIRMQSRNAKLALRRFGVLGAIVAVGGWLRLWNIHGLFDAVHDYDPGTHALAGRYIAEGLLPYRDFISVHPPLYDLTLGVLFRAVGYDFFLVSYLSVIFSLACVLLVYAVGRRLYDDRVGLIAAGFFAVEPMMVHFGRRGVQESMGFCLLLVGVLMALHYLESRRIRTLFMCGIVLGLVVATKYVFVPVVAGVSIALLFVSVRDETWVVLRHLGAPRFWAAYWALVVIVYAAVFFLQMVVGMPVPLPFIDPVYAISRHVFVVLLVFFVPLLMLWRYWPSSKASRAFLHQIWRTVKTDRLWVLPLGGAAGFLAVTAYFWVTVPREFVEQTFLWQSGRFGIEIPSLLGIVRLASAAPAFFRMSLLSVLAALPICFVLVNRRCFRRSDCFIVVVIAITLLLSQAFYQLPRYYAPVLLFTLLGLASLVFGARIDGSLRSLTAPLAVTAVVAIAVVVSAGILRNYGGYDIALAGGPTERTLYEKTNAFLTDIGARKVFSTNPIYPALTDAYESSLVFDTYALWFLQGDSGEQVVAQLVEEGVDHVLVDSWARFWGTPPESIKVQEVLTALRRHATLVGIVAPDSGQWVEVYSLEDAAATMVNGDFTLWSDYSGLGLPVGWNPVLIGGTGDSVDIRPSGELTYEGVRLTVYENGLTEGDSSSTHAGLSRRLAFPRTEVSTVVMPDVNTEALGAEPLGPAIHFLDGEGHSVILGFSDEVEQEQVSVCGECGHVAVIQPAPLHRWSEHSIDVAKYWKMGGWDIPEELTVLVVLSAHADHPGYYTFHVASVTVGEPGS